MLNMNETIRARRRALGLTQEQLAGRLGVSAPAVSKWEQGASYPDVTLLPALARALETDLNTLMSFGKAPDRETTIRLMTQVSELAGAQGIDAAMDSAREILREYPNCGALLFGLAATIEGRLIMSGAGGEERGAYGAELTAWYERAAESGDEEARESAAHMLASRLLGEGEIEAAQRMMERLPKEPSAARWPLETALLTARGEREQAQAYLQKTLFLRAGDVQQILLRLIQVALEADELQRAQAIAELTARFVELLHMHPSAAHMARLLPALHRKDVSASLAHIRAALAALEEPWLPGECLLYEKAVVKKGGHITKEMLAGVVKEMAESDEYAFLRENEEFRAILAAYTPAGYPLA